MSFIHVHNHSHYSMLKASMRVDDIIAEAVKQGHKAVALTDLGNLHGALEFYKKAQKAEIKPIVGVEFDLFFDSLDQLKGLKKDKALHCPCVLWAKDNVGLENIFALSSISQALKQGDWGRALSDFDMLPMEQLLKHKQSLILALAPQDIKRPITLDMDSKLAGMKAHVQALKNVFAEDLYVLLQKAGAQDPDAAAIFAFAKFNQVKAMASNNAFYHQEKDAHAQDVLKCVGDARRVMDRDRHRLPNTQHFMRDEALMQELYAGEDVQALSNTLELVDKCDVSFKLSGYCMPEYDLPEGASSFDELKRLSEEGLKGRWPLICSFYGKQAVAFDEAKTLQSYQERLAEELTIIEGTGFAGYFLIVQDFINHAKTKGIPVGPGRGSAAGSLVAYALRITDVDPIPYNLLFERFLNAERISMPDIDVDFCQDGRDQVIEYVAKKYDNSTSSTSNSQGSDAVLTAKVAQIGTFGKLQAKAVLRDVGRALGMPYGQVDKIAKLVPNVLNISLQEALDQEEGFALARQEDARVNELIDVALSLEGLTRHSSVHAAGVVVSDAKPLAKHVPLSVGQNNEMVTQWDMKAVETVGLVKFDFLGLKTLTLLDQACQFVEQKHNKKIDLLDLNMSDPKVFDILSKGSTQGVFQLESSGMRDLVIRLKPNSFEDIVALVALYRPGPLGSGMVDDFISRKHGKTEIVYDLPELEPILKDTYGVILYQEQVMQIASKLASYSLGEADLLRRAMGKKIAAEMTQQKERFMSGAVANGFGKDVSKKIFDLMEKFAGYGFNKSHSAAYALISYQTAYLKAHYPAEFMAACMNLDKGNTDRIVKHVSDCKKQGIVVSRPNINESLVNFSVQDSDIVYGLSAVKNVGEAAIDVLVKERQANGPFKDLQDLATRIGSSAVNKKTLEALIKSGAMDVLHDNRAQMMAALESILSIASKQQKDASMGQNDLFGQSDMGVGQDLIDDSIAQWSKTDSLDFEKAMLGFYVSGHPLDEVEHLIKAYASCAIADIDSLKSKKSAKLSGVIVSKKEITTKKGDRMAFATLEDLSGSLELVIFKDVFAESKDLLKGDAIILAEGECKLEDDGTAKMIVESLSALDQSGDSFAGELRLKLKKNNLDLNVLEKLDAALKKHPGDVPCSFYIEEHEQWLIKLKQENKQKVSLNAELLLDLRTHFSDTLDYALKSNT